jgi:hypothetical protein
MSRSEAIFFRASKNLILWYIVWVGLVLSVLTVEFFAGLEIVARHGISSHEHAALSNGFLPYPDTLLRFQFATYPADQYDGGKINCRIAAFLSEG